MQYSPARPMTGSKLRTALMGVGFLGLVGVALLGLWWMAAMRTPEVTIPNPVMPNPNAFDFYVKAGNAILGAKDIGEAVSSKPKVAYSIAQKEALIQQNAGAIGTLHQGFAYSYLNPPCRSLMTPFPYYAKFRGMARLLSLQGQVRAKQGDWSGTADSCLDTIQMGEEIPHGAVMIGALTGIACQAIGRRPLWIGIEHLNAAQSRTAITRLAHIMDKHRPYADTVQEEKWALQAGLLEIFNNPGLMKNVYKADDPNEASRAKARSTVTYLTYSKSRIMNDFTAYMDALEAQARQPYSLHLPLPPTPTDPINSMIIPEYEQARLKHVDNETQNGLLLVTLALRAYQGEHGRYPASLAELTPAYLKKLPDDPFALQGTFKYRVDGTSYVLYSVGPDGKDDGGTPINDPKKATDMNQNSRYYVEKNSIGDVVAGKNLW
ncbi:MAG: hypothetical protein JWL77_5668 [Chthonomonadaceae bacterium]|nr:hypothetical protein [Chthonomonadaceae bacterium]